MSDCMHFPDTVEEFMEQYKMTDTKQVYSNGIEYVPIFRMKQWFEHEKAQLSSEGTTSDLISRTETVEHLRRMLESTVPNTDYDEGFVDGVEFGVSTVSTMPTIQPVATDTNVGNTISKFIDGLEEIFADLRERHVDDSVCGLCEYDGAYMGQSGDLCNECPGFDRDDCFKLSDETRKKWTEEIINALPTIQPERQKGEWIDYTEDGYVECPFCHSATNCDGNKDELHFCFSCGADMRGEQDERG